MNCHESEQHLQRLLDGDGAEARETVNAHLAICPECRELFAAASLLQRRLRERRRSSPPENLTRSIVAGVLSDRGRRLRWRTTMAVAAVAATLLLMVGGGYLWLTAPVEPDVEGNIVQRPEPPRAVPMNETDSQDSRRLAWREVLEPPTQSLLAAGKTVSTGLEPVTTSARRAVDLFIREIEPLDQNRKGGS
jgi:anti-sigma factor RsiW